MYTSEEAAALEERNYHNLREIIRINYTIGFNSRTPTRWDFALRLWSMVLIIGGLISFYGHWQLFIRYVATDMPRVTESVTTVLQASTSILKIIYFLRAPREFYSLLQRACRHQLLLDCELFELIDDLPMAAKMRQQVNEIMDGFWLNTRRQLLVFLYSICLTTINNLFMSLGMNFYRYFIAHNESFDMVLPLPTLYPSCMDKGFAFPCFHVPMFLESCGLYLCGLGGIGFDVIFIALCLHCVALMKTLCHMIECATDGELPQERRVQYLRCCIYQYQRVASYLNECYKQIILGQFLLSLLVWGLVLFTMSIGISTSATTTLRMMMYLAAAGYQIVIYCYNGQRFTSASEEIPAAFYACAWQAENREFRRLIYMMIMRTNRGFKLQVSWFSTMTLPTFAWSTSMLTALRLTTYLIAATFQVVIYCYNGQYFASASEEIPAAFYACAWQEENREFRRLIYMMIMRTNRGFKLQVSWFTTMELPTFLWFTALPALYPGCMDKGMTFPYYHIPMLLETFALYICGMGAFGFDVIFIVLCLHCVGLMQSLCHMIECATASELPRELRVQYLRCCIYQYQRVAAFALELNACFRQIILIQFLLSLLVWGLVLFQMSVGIASSFLTTLRMFMYLAAGGYQIVIYCYNGQLFASAAEQIPKAFYECNWHEESQEFRQLVRMMIMRSNRSFKLDVSWFSTMTLPTLMSVRILDMIYVCTPVV
ncbi:Or63a [Drosophila busckii]|uniref:Or63a n=1 Tax=Drosophila busckii TaxID=30019 RepID=A0A0M3QVU3_DROBS|nr:Or63a [Drosophila busckii]